MRIEKLEQLPGGGKIRLWLDDGTKLRLPVELVLQHGLSAGQELPEEELNQISNEAGLASAKQRAVRILSASGTSEKELYRKLVQKGESGKDAAAAVSWLEELNLLDDAEAARQLVRREAAKGYGKAHIKQSLFQKGIPKEYWAEALTLLPDPQDYLSRYLESKLPPDPDEKQKKKVIDALLRRGYSWEEIRTALLHQSVSVGE